MERTKFQPPILTAITEKKTVINLFDIANTSNIYFVKVAIDIQSSIRFPTKKYFDYLLSLKRMIHQTIF